eukprot:CAMPEP_0196576474 /NCGR_PEP_ID=MMETSP1081-20130531/5721_1 /TAXON_ID=36882 /ORGANISM="Pyramimonas amylifera, Strain CCMP720" /LENGTH=250 /DNA_ID=CAMNT_0041895083 /DNA_START=86 /DNA_END=834 /DNA_ORIENTATION=+
MALTSYSGSKQLVPLHGQSHVMCTKGSKHATSRLLTVCQSKKTVEDVRLKVFKGDVLPSNIVPTSPITSKDSNRQNSSVAYSTSIDSAGTENVVGIGFKPSRNWVNIYTNLAIFGGAFLALFYKGYLFESTSWTSSTYLENATQSLMDLWMFYETNSVAHPLLVPAVITGVTYGLADWISQTYEGRFALDFDSVRLLRNAAIGFLLLGPFAHLYYVNQELLFKFILPSEGEKPWWSVPAHIALDQSLYTA